MNILFRYRSAFIKIVICISVVVVLTLFTHRTRNRIVDYAKFTITQNTSRMADQISGFLKSTRDSIKFTSQLAEKIMASKDFKNSTSVLNSILPSTPFTTIDFINKSGIATLTTGNQLDTSNLTFYTDGIKGNSGMVINYHPKLTKDILIQFYSPLFFEGENTGVVTGSFSASQTFLPLMKASFMGKDMIGVLVDENKQVICSTLEYDGDTTLSQILESIGIKKEWIEAYYEKINSKNNEVFRFDGKKGYSYACIYPIKETGWSIVQIVPSPIFHEVLYQTIYDELFTILFIIAIGVSYLISMRIKYKRNYKEHEQREAALEAETIHDNLTGLLNRRAFDNAIELLEAEVTTDNLIFVVLDVNGLKKINDTTGHEAGDELIKGAAECIQHSFSKSGTCYRIGGDEFSVIIQKAGTDLDSIIKDFKQAQEKWHGKKVKKLTVSFGIAKSSDYPTLSVKRLLHIADKEMYYNKKMFYAEDNKNR